MRMRFYLAAIALLGATASPAQAQSIAYRLNGAAFTSHGVAGDPGLHANEQMVTTFDGNDGVTFDAAHSSGYAFYTGDHAGVALAPAGDDSRFAAIGAGGQMSFDLRQFNGPTSALASISVDVGSIDSYNFIQILGLTCTGDLDYDHPLFTLDGDQMMGAGGRDGRLTFGFGDDFKVGGIVLGSTGIAFEFDSLAVSIDKHRGPALVAPPVPEPASWAMMLGGFGLVGGAMRSRRKSAVSFG